MSTRLPRVFRISGPFKLVLPGTDNNALSVRNVVDAWIKSA